jgi:glycosyltransferase involved in cell wall biosynthesis
MIDNLKNFLTSIFSNKQANKCSFSEKINLLIELDTFDKGGLQKVVLDSALRFNPNLFDVTIVSINGTGYLANLAKNRGVRVYGLPVFNKNKYYEKIVKNRKINLSNSHFSQFGYSILKKNRIPNVTFIHNVYAFLTGDALLKFQKNDQNVDLYISVSNKATQYAVEKLKINENKIKTIPNGLIVDEHLEREKNAVALSRSEFGFSESDYVFLNPASYNLHKGHYVMIDAMKKVLKYRKDIKILCIGNIVYKPHYIELTDYLNRTGLNKYIQMPGYFPNIENIYPIVDAFLMPSFIEGWSIAMNEAMFYKKPMIMTDTGGASEVINNNDIGIIVENEYGEITNLYSEYLDEMAYNWREFQISEQLASAMNEFASNKSYWKKAGENGRKKILNEYNFDYIIKKYEDTYKKMLGFKGNKYCL